MTFLEEIINEIPQVNSLTNEKNEKLENIPKNIALLPNPGKDAILAKQLSRFSYIFLIYSLIYI